MTARRGGVAKATEPFGADLTCVVADTLKFRRKLRIGEDAYAVLRLGKGVQSLWDVGGVALTGASVAASKVVASMFFASSGGLLAAFGIGAAATPIGWVVAAAVATGSVYWGVSRMVRQQTGSMVDTIPRFINTPIDLLGMQLFDLMGALALRVAAIDGKIAKSELASIKSHFVEEWGFDVTYATRALDVLVGNAEASSLKAMAKAIADFQAANPDCNGYDMQRELMAFLRDVVAADGVIDEREELALEAVYAVFRAEKAVTLSKVATQVAGMGSRTAETVGRTMRRMARPPKLPKTVAED
jgi:uncharacterized tellurite resistance protein B-like protein